MITGNNKGDLYEEVTIADIDNAIQKASDIFETYKGLVVDRKILFLEKIAEEIAASRSALISTAGKETHLPVARLEGETDRTINQIKMFIDLLKEGSWVNAVIDTEQPDRSPFPKPDIRQLQRPLGVVAVFGAGNFPFAFSVAGGDTISALAAGCPVLFKVHNGHPRTSYLTGECIRRAAYKADIPAGVFTLLHIKSNETAIRLVTHPLVNAVAFTGSFAGGKTLYDAAAQREVPIPVYAEMGSVNPVFLLPGKMKESAEEIAKTLTFSNTLGTGQFCTNPGLIIRLKSAESEQFESAFKSFLSETAGGTMLTHSIYHAYCDGITDLLARPELTLISEGKNNGQANAGISKAFSIAGRDFLLNKAVAEECFGPVSIHVIAEDEQQLIEIAKSLSGQLTASVWANLDDCKRFENLFQVLENKAGRLLINNAPTGVEVTHAMVHGGPFPATTDATTTSVGSRSIYRFTRPVCYQDFPDILLPAELKTGNPRLIWRLVNGELTKNAEHKEQ